MLLLGKGVFLLSGYGLEEAAGIPVGESGGQSPIEKDGKLFSVKGGRGDFEIHDAHESSESIILRKVMILIRLFNHISK